MERQTIGIIVMFIIVLAAIITFTGIASGDILNLVEDLKLWLFNNALFKMLGPSLPVQ